MTPSEGMTTGGEAASGVSENVGCPFCGILCDDLTVQKTGQGLKVLKNGCDKAVAGFERQVGGQKPQIAGKDCSLEEAIAAAASILKASRQPMFGGLATDVEGMRAVMQIAERSGGVIDHALSDGQYRNFKVLQTSGWFMSTLTEVRNRADLIVVVGSDLHKLHPRFFERIVNTEVSLLSDSPEKRTVVFLGDGLDRSGVGGARIGEVINIPCPPDRVGEVIAAVRALINNRPLGTAEIAGIKVADIQSLADRCKAAKYGIMVWAPPGLAFANADLTVHLVSELVKELNVTTRFAGLSLGGNEGAVTAGAVCSWQSGYPLRVSYASGAPDYDAHRYSIGRMLASGEGDALFWIASFTPDIALPETKLPTVVLGTPGLKMAQQPAVMIPVGTPGADHAGRLVRCDNVVSLPLRNLRRAALPSVASVLGSIESAL